MKARSFVTENVRNMCCEHMQQAPLCITDFFASKRCITVMLPSVLPASYLGVQDCINRLQVVIVPNGDTTGYAFRVR